MKEGKPVDAHAKLCNMYVKIILYHITLNDLIVRYFDDNEKWFRFIQCL